MDEILFKVLAEGVGRYLDTVDGLATRASGPAGTELRRLSGAWRALLRLHQPGTRRRCTGCYRRGVGCTVWRIASAYFLRRLGT
ncbi:MAG TPA: hypothetical protein VFV67_13085 [Actinophytocola sp.]|uniref:hypothetical protein n=1 Tax=Actinophytocola sp. TaxID=1872138 RepID=UPI002DBA821E|nr:hypothetical protein [Actinophytocola sp.]HEU5471581.1 hypothetical protein [Actinophytocola sp.]